MNTSAASPSQARRLLALGALLVLLAFVLAACGANGGSAATSATPTSTAAGTTPSAGTTPPSITEVSPAINVAEALRPSVVDVTVFDAQGQRLGLGSGVIYRADGLIVTNDHVVTDREGQVADGITVTLITGKGYSATLVGRDPLSDLAVLRIDQKDLPAATFLKDLSQVQVGQYAFAIGTPLGLGGSVTMGIVSAINREVPDPGSLGSIDLIQTDAAISPGNSGGALADNQARVIGINVAAIAGGETRAQNIGFAIPSDLVVTVVEQIIATGKVTYGYLGIQSTTITPELQDQYSLSRSEGVLVVEVQPGSPAADAGVKQGDVIVQIGDQKVASQVDLFSYLRGRKPGDQVELQIVRGGGEQTQTVTLGSRPGS